MAFVNITLLIGGLFTAIPVIVHLVMRREPQRQVFPALMFLKQRQENNRRQLQVRHWLLLFLRCAALALLALTLARPSVAAEGIQSWLLAGLAATLMVVVGWALVVSIQQKKGRWLVVGLSVATAGLLLVTTALAFSGFRGGMGISLGNSRAPVAAVLVFDTTPRMEYRFENQTRLEAAQEMATWLLGQLPPESQIAVLDTGKAPTVFSVDMAAARKSVERLQTSSVAEDLVDVIGRAVELGETSSLVRKEVYVFSDLARAEWDKGMQSSLKARLEASPAQSLYIIDVGVDEPHNIGIGSIRLSNELLTGGGELVIETDVRANGAQGTQTVELYVEQSDEQRPLIVDGEPLLPEAERRDRRQFELADGEAARLDFRLHGFRPGVYQGYVKLTGNDSLPVDDIRYFAVEVRDPWQVLIAAPDGINTSFLTEAIAPFEFRQTNRARFDCAVVDLDELSNQPLEQYDVICLVNPSPLPPAVWKKLLGFVEMGGGLGTFLGHQASPNQSFQDKSAIRLLGGRIKRQWRAGNRDLYLVPRQMQHPILLPFRELATSIPWNLSPVFRHWELDNASADSTVVMSYSNGKAALIDTQVGNGHAVTLTTPISDPVQIRGRQSWNELPTSEVSWPYFVLINELMVYLADEGSARLNYQAGETATLANDPNRFPDRYQLFTPRAAPEEIAAYDGRLTVRFTDHPGAYRLKAFLGEPIVRGFAVNASPEFSKLQRIELEQLDDVLGADRYRFARDRESIELNVGQERVGLEFYPYLLAMVVLVLGLEHVLANRFYRQKP